MSSIGSLTFYRILAPPPKVKWGMIGHEFNGINGTLWHKVGVRGQTAQVPARMVFTTAELRAAFEIDCMQLTGTTVTIVDDCGITWQHLKVLDCTFREWQTLANDSNGGNYWLEATFEMKCVATDVA